MPTRTGASTPWTPPEAVRALMAVDHAILDVLAEAGHIVHGADAVGYGSCPGCTVIRNYLAEPVEMNGVGIITNPPFRLAEVFIRKAISLAYELFGIRWPVAVLARSSAKPDLDLESPLADDAPARLERAEDNEQRGLLLDGLGDRERGPVQARLVRLE